MIIIIIMKHHRNLCMTQDGCKKAFDSQWRTQEFFSGEWVQKIQLRKEDRENGDLVA